MPTLGMDYMLATEPTPPTGLTQLAASPKGGWAEPQRSKALQYGGYTYVGWVAGGSSGDCGVTAIENADLTNTTDLVLHAALGGNEGSPDMHGNPSLLVRDSDHKLMAFYCAHNDSTIRLRISTTSLDTDPDLSDGFASEVSLHSQILAGGVYDYPIAVQLTGETNDPIYLFFRNNLVSSTARWLYSKSTDGGATWAANSWLYRRNNYRTYGQINSNGVDRIDFLFTSAFLETTNNTVVHWYYEGESFYKSDGTLIGAAPLAAPLVPDDATLVADSGHYHLFGLERDAVSGDIAATLSVTVTGVYHVKRIYWDGASWALSAITTSEAPYSWGNVIDPEDFDHALVSRWVDGRAELWEYTLSGTWSGVTLTPAPVADWMWPIYVKDYASEIKAVVLFGTYTTYLNYAMATYGVA